MVFIASVFYLFLYSFTFCSGGGACLLVTSEDATPRDCDVVHILVRKCGRGRRPKPEESKLSGQVLPLLTALFSECPCGFYREFVGSSKIRLKMSAIESIL